MTRRSSRILAVADVADVADVAEALSAQRPYRSALGPDEVLALMRQDARRALDADAFAALEQALVVWSDQARAVGRAGHRSSAGSGRVLMIWAAVAPPRRAVATA